MNGKYGVVVIGRNEGERLVRCLTSLRGRPVVYVDSGSTDDSVARAKQLGAKVVQLDMALPFTAARARNAGLLGLQQDHPGLEFVQFVDGDCQVAPDWLDTAWQELRDNSNLAAVCGRRREINKEASIYNLLCDIEWDTPIGTADACGGDAMYRIDALREAGMFNENFIAGEEPELCYRIRRYGWKIRRIDAEMTRHDADMHRFKQWWKRSERSGYAYALGAWEHGGGPERYKLKACISVVLWAGAVPLAALLVAVFNLPVALAMLVFCYGYLGFKVYGSSRQRHPRFSRRQLLTYTAFLVLQKFPELVGVARCSWQQLRGQRMNIIEYK